MSVFQDLWYLSVGTWLPDGARMHMEDDMVGMRLFLLSAGRSFMILDWASMGHLPARRPPD